MHQKLKRFITKRNVIILSILIALGLVTGVTVNYVDKKASNDVEINLVESEENSSVSLEQQETNEAIEEIPQQTDEREVSNDERESVTNSNQVITISRPQWSYINRPLTHNSIQSTTTTPPLNNQEPDSPSSSTSKPQQNPTPDQPIKSVDVGLTLFLDEYHVLNNDGVQVKVGNEQEFNAQTSEKGFLKLQLPYDSTTHLTHPSIESRITVNVNGEVSVENIKGESMIGFMERSEEGEVKYRENITTFPTEIINNIELLDLESGQFIYNGALELEPNQILVIPAFDQYVSGIAIKVVSVKVEGAKTIAVIVQPELKEVYRSIDIEVEPRLEDAHVTLAEGVELAEAITYSRDSFAGKLKKFANENIEVEGTFSVSVENKLKINIDFDWFDIDVKEIKYELDMGTALEFEVEYMSISDDDNFEKKLLDFSIPTPVAGISVDIPVKFVVEPEGSLISTLSVENNFEFGIQYTRRNGLNTFPEKNEMFSSSAEFTPVKFEGELSAGFNVAANLAALRIDLIGLGLGLGATVEVTAEAGVDSNGVTLCTEYELGAYGSIGLESEIIPDIEDANYRKEKSLLEGQFGLCREEPEIQLEILPKNIVMIPGESIELMVMSGREEVTYDATYESSDSSKLSVDANGVMTANHAGVGHTVKVKVTYEKDGVSGQIEIPVMINDPASKGILKGQITDAVSESPINRAKITLYDESGGYLNKYYTDEGGHYQLFLDPGIYLVSIEKVGYLKESGKFKIESGNVQLYQPTLHLIGEANSGEGTVRGKITNAINDYLLSQVKLEIYKGFNSDDGELVTTIYTNELGEYNTVLPAGNYTAILTKDGFIESRMAILAVGDQIRVQPTLSLSPDGLSLTDIRVVLNWGQSPSDLDSHLIGTTNGNLMDYFHVYYSSTAYQDEAQSAYLDRDDTSSYGPETITLTNLDAEGHYVYAIHNYSSRESMESKSLSHSGATVKVYSRGHLLSSFTVPSDQVGNVWKVFEIIDGEIVPLNEMTSTNNFHDYQSYLPNRVSSMLLIEPLSQEILLSDEKQPILGEMGEEVTKPEESEPGEEVTKPEESETGEEVTKPEESEPSEEVTKPEESEPGEEVMKPEESGPGEEVTKPEESEPGEEVMKPEESEPGEEVMKPEESEPGEEVTKPEESETDEEVRKPEESETDEEVAKPEESETNEEVIQPEEVEVSIEEIISKDIEIKLIEADIKK